MYPYTIFWEFFFSFTIVILISITELLGDESATWPIVLGIALFPFLEFTARAGIDGITGQQMYRSWCTSSDNEPLRKRVAKIISQFLGGLVGAIVICLIYDAPAYPRLTDIYADNDWSGFKSCLMIAIIQMFTYLACTKSSVFDLAPGYERSAIYTAINIFNVYALQLVVAGAFGHINIDLCRMLGSKIVHDGETNFKDELWWIITLGPILAIVLCFVLQRADGFFQSMENGAVEDAEDTPVQKESGDNKDYGALKEPEEA